MPARSLGPGVLLTALALAGCAGEATAPARQPTPAATPGPKVFPVELAGALDAPGRDTWQRPDAVVAALDIRPGERIADIGCGTGYFTFRLADATGARGRVLAVDIQQEMLDILASRLTPAYRPVIELRLSQPSTPLEPGDDLDLVFCANTLHEVDDTDQADFVARLVAGLRPGGRLALLDWRPKPMRLGPPTANRIAPERVRSLAAAAGLELTHDHDLLPTHSFLVFRKPGG